MPDIRVEDEKGTVHVFPDGSTPEMIASAMNVKPPESHQATFGEGMAHASVFRNLSEQLGKAADWAEGKASKADIENLKKVAGGEPTVPMEAYSPRAGYDLLSRVTRFASGALEPKNVAISAGAALANTNPITGIPVDAALVAHGGYGVAKNISKAGTPEGMQNTLLSGSEMAGGVAGAGTQRAAITSGSFANRLYQSALKPSTTLSASQRARVIQTGLQNEIPVSTSGVERIANLVDDLNTKIADRIASKPGAKIDPQAVASRISNVKARFRNQVNAGEDLTAIEASRQQFLREAGAKPGQPAIPPQPSGVLDQYGQPIMGAATPATAPKPAPPMSGPQAQALKQGTYQQLKSRAYGELKSAAVESQKALARGLKEELVAQFPEIADLNAKESNLIGLDKQLERAVGRIENHQMLGIGTPLAAAGAKAVTGSSGVAAAVGVLKAIFDDPFIKSKLAISISKGSKGTIPLSIAQQKIGLYGAALGAAAGAQPPARQDNEQ